MGHESADVPFFEVRHAVADADGNVYCAGTFPAPAPKRDDEPHSYYTTSDFRKLFSNDGIWSYDAGLRAGSWRREGGPIGWLAMHAPGWLSVFMDPGYQNRPFVISTRDGSLGDGPHGALRSFRRVHLDGDGTFVALVQEEEGSDRVVRVSPTKNWSRVPIFEPTGFFARMLVSNELVLDTTGTLALASDGDLVVCSKARQVAHLCRFDRGGRRLFDAPAPLKGSPREMTLVRGRDGIVWAWAKGELCAVTREAAITNVLGPGMSEGLGPALAALPDGTLLFFGDDGRLARARTNGAQITSFEIVPLPTTQFR
jgi:hypothetical protein